MAVSVFIDELSCEKAIKNFFEEGVINYFSSFNNFNDNS